VIDYASHGIADALEREVVTIKQRMADQQASLDALQAAIDELRRQGAA
jgi:hypothetical protein